MAAQSVSFQNPLDPVGQALALQNAQHVQDLADALQKQSFAPIPDNGAPVGWSQGIAKLAEALAANHLRRSAMSQQYGAQIGAANAKARAEGAPGDLYAPSDNPYSTSEAGRNLGQRLGDFVRGGPPVHPHVAALAAALNPQAPTAAPSPAMNGAGGGMGATPSDGVAQLSAALSAQRPTPAPPVMPGSQPGFASDMSAAINSGMPPLGPPETSPGHANVPSGIAPRVVGVAGPTPAGGDPGFTGATPPSSGPPTQMPSADRPAQSAPAPPLGQPRAPLALTDDWQRNAYLDAANHDEYSKALIKSNSPTDAELSLIRAGIDPKSPQGQAAMVEASRKATLTPIGDDRRGYLYDPYTGAPKGYHPMLETGQQPTADANGNITGAATLPGFAQSASNIAQAKASGEASGKAPYEFVPSFNNTTQQPTSIRKDVAVGMSGPGSSGGLNGHYGATGGNSQGGIPTGPALGLSSAANEAGKNSANSFNGVIQSAQGARDLGFALGRIGDLAKSLPGTGSGYEAINTFKSRINTVVQQAGGKPWFDNAGVANTQEVQKYVSQIAQLQAQTLGGPRGPTDARLAAAVASLADVNKAPRAIQAIVSYGQAVQAGALGKQAAAAAWLQSHGPDTFPAFNAVWQTNYDPRVYQWMQEGPAAFKSNVGRLTPAQQDKFANSWRALKAMGALPQ